MKNKIIINIVSFVGAYFIVHLFFELNQNNIIKYYENIPKVKNGISESIKKSNKLLFALESGTVVLFGSSELTNTKHKYIPVNFFNKELAMPLVQNGHEGHQCFVILSQLSAYSNEKVKKNARVVIFLSPGWFTGGFAEGTSIPNFLEYMTSDIMYRLYYQSDVNEYFKNLISKYVEKNINKIKLPPCIYRYASNYRYKKSLTTECSIEKAIFESVKITPKVYKPVAYNIPQLDYNKIIKDAKKVTKPSTNNSFGVYNEYYSKYIEPSIKKGDFPYTIKTPPSLYENQEFQDFLNLLKILKEYKIKPLFLMQDLNPYIYVENRDSMQNILFAIKKKITEYGYGYLDMWTYNKSNYEMGTLTDVMHTGELGWIKIDKKIIEHFNLYEDTK